MFSERAQRALQNIGELGTDRAIVLIPRDAQTHRAGPPGSQLGSRRAGTRSEPGHPKVQPDACALAYEALQSPRDRGMNGFVIELEDRPGSFAAAAEALASRGVNVLVTAVASRGGGVAAFICDDEDSARAALADAGIDHREIPTLHVHMEDRPGQAAQISRELADAGVSLQFWMPIESIWATFLAGVGGSGEAFTVAIGVDDAERARAVLGKRVVD